MQSNAEDLSQYVVSIVKNNKDSDTLRAYFLTDLRTFLKGDTPLFVNKLMKTLAGIVLLFAILVWKLNLLFYTFPLLN